MAVYKSLATVGMYSGEGEATDRPEKIREQLHYAPHDRPQVDIVAKGVKISTDQFFPPKK